MNPLAALYGAATAMHSSLFERGMLRTRYLSTPVVSVGNLSTGGAGKTPFVIALGGLLQARGVRFDVLSRGYRRETRGVLVVDPAGSAAEFGDEPLLIARRLGVPVIVGKSRYDAGRVGEEQFQPQLHLLDDGFQHRSLGRDFDIVLMTGKDFEDRLLPAGRLREPLSALRRADAIVLPEGVASENPALREKTVWHARREVAVEEAPPNPVAFCGIARPKQFFAQLRGIGIVPAAEISFCDHHRYEERDVERLLAQQRASRADGFLTTEKDAINLEPLKSRLNRIGIVTLKIAIDRPDDMVETILARIASRKPRS